MRVLLLLAAALIACRAAEWSWYVQPCGAAESAQTGCQAGDVELARWALEAWSREAGGAIHLSAAKDEVRARVRMLWANGRQGLYGETRGILVDGQQGAIVFVLPQTDALGPAIAQAASKDPLFRDSVVYLTCVHELGHAFGLPHTSAFSDIMYSFGYGGDVLEYFQRYRKQIRERKDIRGVSGISADDKRVLLAGERH